MNIALFLTCVPNLTSYSHLLEAIVYNANDLLHLIQTHKPNFSQFPNPKMLKIRFRLSPSHEHSQLSFFAMTQCTLEVILTQSTVIKITQSPVLRNLPRLGFYWADPWVRFSTFLLFPLFHPIYLLSSKHQDISPSLCLGKDNLKETPTSPYSTADKSSYEFTFS